MKSDGNTDGIKPETRSTLGDNKTHKVTNIKPETRSTLGDSKTHKVTNI